MVLALAQDLFLIIHQIGNNELKLIMLIVHGRRLYLNYLKG